MAAKITKRTVTTVEEFLEPDKLAGVDLDDALDEDAEDEPEDADEDAGAKRRRRPRR